LPISETKSYRAFARNGTNASGYVLNTDNCQAGSGATNEATVDSCDTGVGDSNWGFYSCTTGVGHSTNGTACDNGSGV